MRGIDDGPRWTRAPGRIRSVAGAEARAWVDGLVWVERLAGAEAIAASARSASAIGVGYNGLPPW